MDDVVIWSEARTDAQVLAGYAAEAATGSVPPPGTPGVLGSWAFDEGIGQVVADSSGHGLIGVFGPERFGSVWVGALP